SAPNPPTQTSPIPDSHNNQQPGSNNQAHRIRLVPHIDSRRNLRFDPITRDLTPSTTPLRIGRFTDRSGLGLASINSLSSNRLAFKSKVVSRAHAEIYVESGGRFFIKDTKSSSGTFLNHVRLSPANTESRPFQVKDGDILQLGVDYQGGTEDIYKSVKIRIELGREWQAGANAFNTNTLKILKTLSTPLPPTRGTNAKSLLKTQASSSSAAAPILSGTQPPHQPHQIPDCCICLFSVTIRQALFIAPCSHTFHYKCIRPLLETHHPAFSCPLCRTFADLEEDVEVEVGEVEGGEEEEGVEGVEGEEEAEVGVEGREESVVPMVAANTLSPMVIAEADESEEPEPDADVDADADEMRGVESEASGSGSARVESPGPGRGEGVRVGTPGEFGGMDVEEIELGGLGADADLGATVIGKGKGKEGNTGCVVLT
ncbi:hypothetical protein H0H93_001980, partial [Arthromyces matolae]